MLNTFQRLLAWVEGLTGDGNYRDDSLQTVWFGRGFARLATQTWMLALPANDDRTYALTLPVLRQVWAARPERLQVVLDGDGQVTLTYDRQQLTCPGRPGETCPSRPTGDFRPMGSWGEGLLEALARQARFASEPILSGPLSGVYFQQRDGWLDTWATDAKGRLLRRHSGIRLGWCRPLRGILPTGPILALLRQVWSPVELASTDSWLRLSLESGVQLYLRLTQQHKPPPAPDLPSSGCSGWARLDRVTWLEVVSAGIALAGHSTASGEFKVAGGRISVALVDSQGKAAWEAGLPVVEHHGLDADTRLDLRLVARALASLDDVPVIWRYGTPQAESSFSQDGSKHQEQIQVVVMPLIAPAGPDGRPGGAPDPAKVGEVARPADQAAVQGQQKQQPGQGAKHGTVETV